MLKTKGFKLMYNIHGEQKSLNITPEEKISVMNSLVATTYKINIDDYEIYYGGRITNFDQKIKEVIGNELQPLFTFKKIIKPKPEKSNFVIIQARKY
jgi:hypothetical protein